MKTVVGVFSDANQARQTFNELVRSGFGQGDISVVTNTSGQQALNLDLRTTDLADTGPIVGRGPLVDAMMKSTGTKDLSSSLRNCGLSAQLAEHYAAAVKSGETLESLVVDDKDADRAVAIMSQHAMPYETTGGPSRGVIGGTLAGAGVAGAAVVAKAKAAMEATTEKEEIAKRLDRRFGDDETTTIPILQEEIRVGTREVERGHIHISVRATEHPVSESVNLREEHIYVERKPANRIPMGAERFGDTDLDLTERGEEPVIEKDVKVVEEIVIRKRLEAHDEMISDKVRNMQAEVKEDRFDPSHFRKHFESLGAKGKFEEHLPAYQLGHQLRSAGATKWEDVESKAKGDWESKRPGTWEKIKEHVRYAWSKGRS